MQKRFIDERIYTQEELPVSIFDEKQSAELAKTLTSMLEKPLQQKPVIIRMLKSLTPKVMNILGLRFHTYLTKK